MINFPIINEEPLEKDFLTGKPVGAFKAAGMGMARYVLEAARGAAIFGSGAFPNETTEDTEGRIIPRKEDFLRFNEKYINPVIEWYTPEPGSVSTAGQIFSQFAVLPLMVLGGAEIMVGTAMTSTAEELSKQGVDKDTAIAASVIAGISTGAITKIPAAGKTLKQTLALATGMPVAGMIQRGVTKELLKEKGYENIAKEYNPFDLTNIGVDLAMSLATGGWAHYTKARAKMPIEVEDAIDTVASFQKKIKDTPFENTYKNNRVNLAAKDKAMQDLAENKPVDVSEQLAELHSTETITPEKKQAWQMTKEEALQNASVNRYGRTEIAGVEPDYTVGMMQKKAELSPEAWIEDGHKRIIKKALQEGKPVPEEVLKDYPEIQEILRKMGPLKPSMPFKKTETPETIAARATTTDAINELHDTVDEVARLNGMEPEIVDIEQGSPEWLELRMGKRMASETPAVLGLSPFIKPADLWAYKTGRKQFKETEAMSVGKLNEEPARNLINQKYETEFKPSVVMKGEFGASLDGISPDGKTILEIKVPYKGKDSQLWKEVQDGKIPEHYRAQLQHQLMISGADAAWFTVYDRKSKGLIMLIEKPNRAMQKKITDAWEKFWPHIAEDRALKNDIISEVPKKEGAGDIPPVKSPQPEGGIEIIQQQPNKTFYDSGGNEIIGKDASDTLQLLSDDEFQKIAGVTKSEFKKQGGAIYYVPKDVDIANSIHRYSREILLGNNKNELLKPLKHELTHWRHINEGKEPRAYYVKPEESISKFMEYMSDPAEVEASFYAEGKSKQEYENFMEKLNWAKSSDAGKLKPFDVGDKIIGEKTSYEMTPTYIESELKNADKYLSEWGIKNTRQSKKQVNEIKRLLSNKDNTLPAIANLNQEIKSILDKDYDKNPQDYNLLLQSIRSNFTNKRLYGELKPDDMKSIPTKVLRIEVLGKLKPDGTRENINPIIIANELTKISGIEFSAVASNELNVVIDKNTIDILKKLNIAKIPNELLNDLSRPAGDAGQSITLPAEDVSTIKQTVRPVTLQEELTPYITLKRPVKSNTVVEWIEKQGKINYNKEQFKGELDILAEKDPRFKTLINKKDKGLTLDELALRAKPEGFIKEVDPHELLDAIEKRKMRISDEEDFLVKEMEFNKPILNDPIEKMVESRLKEEGDLPATFKGKNEATGRVEYDSARERIDDAKNEYHKTKSLEDVFTRIGNCLRNGG